jgi:hypothetical protein
MSESTAPVGYTNDDNKRDFIDTHICNSGCHVRLRFGHKHLDTGHDHINGEVVFNTAEFSAWLEDSRARLADRLHGHHKEESTEGKQA